jgi:hypothetical protein
MDYTGLKTTVMDWLNRPDLAAAVPAFIEAAEARLNRDPRVRQQTDRIAFPITGDGMALPADLRAVDALYLDGPVHYGPISMVGGDTLPRLKVERAGVLGAPVYAAVMGRKLYFSPEPDATYDAWLSYYLRIPALSDAAPTNWLLDEHSDIYRLAALAESAPYLKEDERLVVWENMLNGRLEDLLLASTQEQFSGSLVRRITPLGE